MSKIFCSSYETTYLYSLLLKCLQYNVESQRAIERFHQTSMLQAKFNKDWGESIHLFLFATRKVIRKSLGFSPANVFVYTVCSTLKLLQQKMADGKPQNLCDYICDFPLQISLCL